VSRQTDEVVQFAGVNLTGVTVSNVEAIAKRLKLLHELVPAAKSMTFLVNPTNSAATAGEASELQAMARVLGLDRAAIWSEVMRSSASCGRRCGRSCSSGTRQTSACRVFGAWPRRPPAGAPPATAGRYGLLLPSRLI
jgi:hypothetical protein